MRELVGDDGEVIAEYMLSVMTDEMQRTVDRMEAAKWLSDRGFGKAVQAVDLDVEHHTSFDLTRWLDLTKLSVADLDTVIEILEKAESDEASELLVEREPPGQLTPVPPRGH
ncbi:MAG: hypothetical protein H0T97_04145 [Actinobacteria bacterium]|nr:hypothetical protein [Actinomycetota bacterium]